MIAKGKGTWMILKRWSNSNYGYILEAYSDLSFAPEIGSPPQLGKEPRPFEIFARKWVFFQFWSHPNDVGVKL